MKANTSVIGAIVAALICFTAVAAPPPADTPPKEGNAASAAEQLETAKRELAKMRQRYKDAHPMVKAQLRKIAELEKRLAAEKERTKK